MRNDRHGSGVVLMHVGDIVNCCIIIYVSYINNVDRRIRDIHALHVALARAVRRNVHFARTKREPSDSHTATAERYRRSKTRPANKNN